MVSGANERTIDYVRRVIKSSDINAILLGGSKVLYLIDACLVRLPGFDHPLDGNQESVRHKD